MAKLKRTRTKGGHKSRVITELRYDEARAFLIKQESYCTLDLPSYFRFNDLLLTVDSLLKGRSLSGYRHKSPRNLDHVNHQILSNKDGRYAWRPFELIHPALYISLVHNITEPAQWKLIRKRFSAFSLYNTKIACLSLPVESLTDEKDKAEQVTRWWQTVEQKSIELSLDFQFLIHTDIVACYPGIYTHSIAWALHGKENAKRNRTDKTLIGNVIDNHIQDMRQGQTNGIPQGSVLMALIAEMVLGYADNELTDKIKSEKIEDYQILRYRDDYRIFVNNSQDGERILKCLTEVMIDLGLKLNTAKTNTSSAVISSSIKDDKLNWVFRRQRDRSLQKHLLIIHNHSIQHLHAGSVEIAMGYFYKRLAKSKKDVLPLPLISIVVDIAYRNPRTYAISAAILSKLGQFPFR